MKPGTSLEKDAVAAALKKKGNYGIAEFKEKTPEKKSEVVVIGVSGMT
jgi:hypothetical protein